MSVIRYLAGAAVSIAIHGVAFSSTQQPINLSLASQQQGNAVSIQFIAPAQPQVEQNKPQVRKKTRPEKQREQQIIPPVTRQIKPALQKPLVKKAVVKKIINNIQQTPVKPPEITPVSKVEKSDKIKKIHPVEKVTEQIDTTKPLDKAEENQIKQVQQATNSSSSAQPKLMAKPTFKVKPTPINYPRIAQRHNLQGETLVEVWLDQKGKQIKQRIITSSGHALLDNAALKAIANWQFQQAESQSQSIAYRVQIPIIFKLD